MLACQPPKRQGPHVERAVARNRAILWVLFDTGMSVSELCALRLDDLDRTAGMATIRGKGSRQRRMALGQLTLRHLLSYLDNYRPGEKELIASGKPGEDHLFLSETRLPLTQNSIELLFVRLRKRADMRGKPISPQSLRRNFALRYLQAGENPHCLQELLGYAGMAQIKLYLRWYDQSVHDHTRSVTDLTAR